MEEQFDHLRVIGSTYMGWQAQDLHLEGCSGDATKADPAIGELYVSHMSHGLADLLKEVSQFPLNLIRDR